MNVRAAAAPVLKLNLDPLKELRRDDRDVKSWVFSAVGAPVVVDDAAGVCRIAEDLPDAEPVVLRKAVSASPACEVLEADVTDRVPLEETDDERCSGRWLQFAGGTRV
jgi:hypothetical protein